jgi:hypothetical protein
MRRGTVELTNERQLGGAVTETLREGPFDLAPAAPFVCARLDRVSQAGGGAPGHMYPGVSKFHPDAYRAAPLGKVWKPPWKHPWKGRWKRTKKARGSCLLAWVFDGGRYKI